MGLSEIECHDLVLDFFNEFNINPETNRYIHAYVISTLDARNDMNPIPLYGNDRFGDNCIVFYCKEIPDYRSPFPANIYKGTRIFYDPILH